MKYVLWPREMRQTFELWVYVASLPKCIAQHSGGDAVVSLSYYIHCVVDEP